MSDAFHSYFQSLKASARSATWQRYSKVVISNYYSQLFMTRGFLMDMSKFLPPEELAGSPGGSCTDSEMEAQYPIVHYFLTHAVKPDGSPGQPGTLTVFCDAYGFKIRLADRNRGWDIWAGSPCFSDLLTALEAAFALPVVPWRKAKFQGGGKAPQKKT